MKTAAIAMRVPMMPDHTPASTLVLTFPVRFAANRPAKRKASTGSPRTKTGEGSNQSCTIRSTPRETPKRAPYCIATFPDAGEGIIYITHPFIDSQQVFLPDYSNTDHYANLRYFTLVLALVLLLPG
jgi:hypothetical protein